MCTDSARLDTASSVSSHYLEDALLDDLLAVELGLRGHRSGTLFVVASLEVPWTWFNSGLIDLPPSLDRMLQDDVSPTAPREWGARHCPACPFLHPCPLSAIFVTLNAAGSDSFLLSFWQRRIEIPVLRVKLLRGAPLQTQDATAERHHCLWKGEGGW